MKKDLQNALDDPNTTLGHRDIIQNKPFLNNIYVEWYEELVGRVWDYDGEGILLELGSGGGFLKAMYPEVITSDLMQLPDVDMVCDAESLPFEDNTIAGILMVNVFHHIPRPYLFLNEAQRTLIDGGKIVMIEPANTLFSRFVYKWFHHEPFNPKGGLEIKPGNPLSNSNQAFSYIYFIREQEYFRKNFGSLRINEIQYHTPLRYILSGGLSHRALAPVRSYDFICKTERFFSSWSKYTGLFCTIEIEKIKK